LKGLYLEILGIVFIVFLGSFLHFAFELSGFWAPVALISAVNESVWEHLKLGFWPAVIYALCKYPFLKNRSNFLIAKSVGIYVIPVSIVVLFYSYTTVLGHNIPAVDILIFVVAVILGQGVSYRILESSELPQRLNLFALIAVGLLAAAFVVFTFYPPHLPIFRDPGTGKYGIP